jgi:hypothetical protein
MSIKLKAFLTGALGAVSDKFDEERETTKASLANRTKNAYTNYQTYQEQTAALKEEIKKRDSLATSYQDDLTEQERIAIGSDSSNVFLSSYEKVLNAGNPNNRTLRDFIKKKEGASPQNYADWVQSSTSKQPDPVAPSLQESSFFGISAKGQQRQLDRASGSVGLSTNQLMAFEKQVDKPMLTPTASLNAEALQLPKSAAETEALLFDKFNKTKEGTPERAAAVAEADVYAKSKEKFDEASGNLDHQKIFTQNRFKAYNIKAYPDKYSPEDRAFAETFIANDGKRERKAQLLAAQAQRAFNEGQPLDLTGTIADAIKDDLAMIPQGRSPSGKSTYLIDGQKYDEGNPVVKKMLQAAKINAAHRILTVGLVLDENGMFKTAADRKLLTDLSATGINVVVVDGKQYLDMPTPTTQEGYDNLPSGTTYRDTDGKVNIKG